MRLQETSAEVNLSAPTPPTSPLSSHPLTPMPTTKIHLKRKTTTNPVRGRINAPRRSNGQFENVKENHLESEPKACTTYSTTSTSFAGSWTSAPTEPVAISDTGNFVSPSSNDIANMIYSTYILQHLTFESKSLSSLELRLRKNIF